MARSLSLSVSRSLSFLLNLSRHSLQRARALTMANRAALRLARCSSRLLMLELDAKSEPLYFALSSERGGAPADGAHALSGVSGGARLFSLHTHSGTDRVARARRHAELQRRLTQDLPADCRVFLMLTFLPNVPNSAEQGFLLRDVSASGASERVLTQLAQSGSVCVFSYKGDERGVCWWREVWAPDTQQISDTERYYLVPAAAPDQHPATLNIINSDVFYQMKDAYKVLQECSDVIPESKAVLEVVDQQLEDCKPGETFPVIVIEGLDATGKTTLTESLQKALGATLLRSPPQCLAPYRQRFDSEPQLIRRAFYALGNYITAAQIGREAKKAPVIVDRYWHSTAAYAIATALSGRVENLPARGSEIYEWPADLLRPSLVLLLTVSPQERLRRLRHRGLEKTLEEIQLEINQLFREKVEEAYKRIRSPACVVVDASPAPDQVLQQVLNLIKSECRL